MADWGLYSALRGTDNWAQKRQDKMQTLMFLDQEQKMAEANLQKQMELEQGMQEYFDSIAQLDVNPEDQERINAEERKARRDIYKGLAAVNGNLKLYMQTGGISALSKYRRNILNSEAVKNAVVNKTNLANYQQDLRDNKFIKRVKVEVPIMGEDGKPLVRDGKAVTETKEMSMEEAVDNYRKGIVTKLDYRGGETKVKINPFNFSNQPKDPNDPYTAHVVTTGDVKNYALTQGASEEYATELGKKYGKTAIKGSPWYWGAEDKAAAELKLAKARKLMSGGSGSSKTTVLNQTSAKIARMKENTKLQGFAKGKEVMGPEEVDFWNKEAGLKFNSKLESYTPTKSLTLYDRDTGAEYSADNAISVNNVGEYVYDPSSERLYALMDVVYPADSPIDKNPHREAFGFWNEYVDDETRHNWQFLNADQTHLKGIEDGGMDVIRGQAYYDITEKMGRQAIVDQLNKWVNVKSTFEGAAPSATVSDQLSFSQDRKMRILQQMKANNPNVPDEEIIMMYEAGIRQ